MPYTFTHKPSDVICQCGSIVKVSYVPKHLLTANKKRDLVCVKRDLLCVKRDLVCVCLHQRAIVGCENVEVVADYKYASN